MSDREKPPNRNTHRWGCVSQRLDVRFVTPLTRHRVFLMTSTRHASRLSGGGRGCPRSIAHASLPRASMHPAHLLTDGGGDVRRVPQPSDVHHGLVARQGLHCRAVAAQDAVHLDTRHTTMRASRAITHALLRTRRGLHCDAVPTHSSPRSRRTACRVRLGSPCGNDVWQ